MSSDLTTGSIQQPDQPAVQGSETLRQLWRYTRRRVLVIALTIIAGVYVTVLVANKDGELDRRVEQQVNLEIRQLVTDRIGFVNSSEVDLLLEVLGEMKGKEAGLFLPTPLRNLRWTLKALTFDWGPAAFTPEMFVPSSWEIGAPVSQVLLDALPNTLLLVGTADLLIFLFGIPLALAIAMRQREGWLDRLLAMLSPLSSIPSWIHGILLVAVFAAWLQILPFGGKYDNLPPENQWGYILVVGRHMILPALAILFGLFFQLVYIWRTFFRIYSEEDYIDLAVAKGLPHKLIEQNYVLRPTMPTILTSFALTLVGFWQMTTALEYFFNWPGIGQLYVKSLPNFLGEHFYRGEMGIVISIVVVFAYLLGLIVLLLDVAYAWLDPRVQMKTESHSLRLVLHSGKGMLQRVRERLGRKPTGWAAPESSRRAWRISNPFKNLLPDLANLLRQLQSQTRAVFREILRYPSAILGLFIILLMLGVSAYTVFAIPYSQIGEEYYRGAVTGRYYIPRNAPPVWINWFRKEDLPTSQILSSQAGTIAKTTHELKDGTFEQIFTLSFDYNSTAFPQELLLHIDPIYVEKRPFISVRWLTPDGREIQLKDTSIESGATYFFSDYVNVRRLLTGSPGLSEWFVASGSSATPPFHLLFADPNANTPRVVQGTYQLELTALMFEPRSDADLEFVLLGDVYGAAGSDFYRRDLLVPLLWGMPFALGFGILGSFVTTVLALIISAAGVWQGGWLDDLVQLLTEVNMIMPVLAIGIIIFALYGVNLYMILGAVVLLNIFSTPTKTFRAAFLQVKEAPYIEAARTYGASNPRIVFRYLIPRILPTMIPQIVVLIPTFVFLEATLAIFNVFDPRYPTWGKVIYEALSTGAWWGGSRFWVLEPISLLLLAGMGFALVGFALERILNPRLLER